jgi:hypothetical protein
VNETYNTVTVYSSDKHKVVQSKAGRGAVDQMQADQPEEVRDFVQRRSHDQAVELQSKDGYHACSDFGRPQEPSRLLLISKVLDIDYEEEREMLVSISQDKTMRLWRQEGAKTILSDPWLMESQLLKCPDDAFGPFLNSKDKNVKARISTNHFTALAFKQDEIDSLKLLAGDLLGNLFSDFKAIFTS